MSAYAIDAGTGKATGAWRFEHDQSILSDICSSAYEASDGSVLVSYATANNRTKARLVGLDSQHGIVFDFEYKSGPCQSSWNAQPSRSKRWRSTRSRRPLAHRDAPEGCGEPQAREALQMPAQMLA